MTNSQQAIKSRTNNARNVERGMNQGVVRPSAKLATTANSRTISQKCVG